VVFTKDAADANDADKVKQCTSVELNSVMTGLQSFEILVKEALGDLEEDAKDAAAFVKKTAMPPFFDYDEDYDPLLNRLGKCEDPDLEVPKDHRVNALDCARYVLGLSQIPDDCVPIQD
jgi:hypothetical protein|tara:strand:+ start:4739 stop:5095 length:357 start_codon:yes stop_codon:yes gene_type:complete